MTQQLVPELLNDCPLKTICAFFRISWCYMDAYSYVVTQFALTHWPELFNVVGVTEAVELHVDYSGLLLIAKKGKIDGRWWPSRVSGSKIHIWDLSKISNKELKKTNQIIRDRIQIRVDLHYLREIIYNFEGGDTIVNFRPPRGRFLVFCTVLLLFRHPPFALPCLDLALFSVSCKIKFG
jgi:hypothetical protein